jgi:hypothetical protein
VDSQAIAVAQGVCQRAHRVKVGNFHRRDDAMRYTFDSCLRTYYGC